MTAADSAHGSNEDDTKACLGFLVYLFTGVMLPFILLHQELLLSSFETGRSNPFNQLETTRVNVNNVKQILIGHQVRSINWKMESGNRKSASHYLLSIEKENRSEVRVSCLGTSKAN